MPESNDECAFIGPHLSRVVLACTSDGSGRCWWRMVMVMVVEGKNTGVRVDGKWEERPRERISGKIIGKFEYVSPRGYDPVEDILEILQASFVRGLLSLSAVFFQSLPYLSFSLALSLFPGFFHPRLLSVFRGPSASPLSFIASARFFGDELNLRASCAISFRFPKRFNLFEASSRRDWKLYMTFASTFANNLLTFEILIQYQNQPLNRVLKNFVKCI